MTSSKKNSLSDLGLSATALPKPSLHLGQSSWRLQLDRVEVWMTRTGGHLAPARFRIGKRMVSPLHVAPWHSERLPSSIPSIVRVLRGDFFCLPFGLNEKKYHAKKYPVHGETANARWSLIATERTKETLSAHFSLRLGMRRGKVQKIIQLRRGESVIYQRHIISEIKGPMNYGHHATLRFPSEGRLSFSPFLWGQVYPGQFENAAIGGYSSLKPGGIFSSLQKVPLADGGNTDLSRYPNREGFEDVAMICSKADHAFAWSAVVFAKEGWAWFALKDPRILPSTLLWHSNGGRHYAPWSGRHRGVLGIEEICSYFQEGVATSVMPNSISRRGIPTCHVFSPKAPLTVNYIMGVVAIPSGFDLVARIEAIDKGVRMTAASGACVKTPVDLSFLVES